MHRIDSIVGTDFNINVFVASECHHDSRNWHQLSVFVSRVSWKHSEVLHIKSGIGKGTGIHQN
jgi:hypothetical protein